MSSHAFTGEELINNIPFRVYTDLNREFCLSHDVLKDVARSLLQKPHIPESQTKNIMDTMRYVYAFRDDVKLKQFVEAIFNAGGPDMSTYLGYNSLLKDFKGVKEVKENVSTTHITDIDIVMWCEWNELFYPDSCALQQVAMEIKNSFAHGRVKTVLELYHNLTEPGQPKVAVKAFTNALLNTVNTDCIMLANEITSYVAKTKSSGVITPTIQTSASQSSEECCVCMNSPKEKSYVFSPCGHRPCCKTCSDSIMTNDSRCPICREVSKYIRIFD